MSSCKFLFVIIVPIFIETAENRELPLSFKKQGKELKDLNEQQVLNTTQKQHIPKNTNIPSNTKSLTQNPNAPLKLNMSRKSFSKLRRQIGIDTTPPMEVQNMTLPVETIVSPEPEETTANSETTTEDTLVPKFGKLTSPQAHSAGTITMPDIGVDLYGYPDFFQEAEDYKGRPLPEDLQGMFLNITEDDLHECMQELTYCLYIHKEDPVCAVSVKGVPKRFFSICEFQYYNCKDGKNSWREIDDGSECNVDASDRDEVVLQDNDERIRHGDVKIVDVPEDKLPKEAMGPPPPDYKEIIVVHSHNETHTPKKLL